MAATPIEGKDLMVFIGTTTKIAVALAKSHKLSIKHASRESSSKDSGIWTSKSKGRLSWDISCDCLVTYDASTNNFESLFDAMIARTPVTLTWALASGTSPAWAVDTTRDIYIGMAYIDSLEVNASDGDDATATVQFTGIDAFAKTNAV